MNFDLSPNRSGLDNIGVWIGRVGGGGGGGGRGGCDF